MKIYKLDREEKEIIKSVNRGEWKPVDNLEKLKEKFSQMAKSTIQARKNKRINIRLTDEDLELIKKKATQEGLPYQTLIGSILHKYAHR
jgi:predicted DNA binding CopG/RHH family protein